MALGVSRTYLLDNYSRALRGRHASVLIGAGISRAADLSDWRGLLREVARDLGLDVDREHDLVSLAQYHVNAKGRAHINHLILDEFLKGTAPTVNHELLARLPLTDLWTTNYDTLIEDAFTQIGKRMDVKRRTADLSNPVPDANVTLYKMHGDAKDADEAVLTKEDYENYNAQDKRQAFSLGLQGQLISKSFLFLGFSFTDPNIEYILSRVRALVGVRGGSEHFCVLKAPTKPKRFAGQARDEFVYETALLEHRIRDLGRYNIQAHLIDDYSEITEILSALDRRVHLDNVYVSGSAEDYHPLGRLRIDKLGHLLGGNIVKRGCNLVSGVGLGIGSAVVSGAVEALYGSHGGQIGERLILRPFPHGIVDTKKRTETFSQWREDMIGQAGFAVFLCGNSGTDAAGNPAVAKGVLEEFDIAVRQGVYPIPVGATGHATAELWRRVSADPKMFYGTVPVKQELKTLNDFNNSEGDYIEAIFRIVDKLTHKEKH